MVDGKTYDGSTSATGSITLNGVVSGDTVDTSGTAFTFSDKNAGAGKTVNVSGTTLTGTDAGNYSLTVPVGVVANILRKAITGTVAIDDKTYDGTTDSTGTISLQGVVDGDAVGAGGTFTFADRNAGTDKTVNVTGVMLTGADAGNYSVTVDGATLADILQRAITVTAEPRSKTSGAPDPSLTWTVTEGSLVEGDSLAGVLTRAPGEAVGHYAVTQGTLDASSNYRLTFVGSTLTITALPRDPGASVGTDARHARVSDVLKNLADRTPSHTRDEDRLDVIDERVGCPQVSDYEGGACALTRPR